MDGRPNRRNKAGVFKFLRRCVEGAYGYASIPLLLLESSLSTTTSNTHGACSVSLGEKKRNNCDFSNTNKTEKFLEN